MVVEGRNRQFRAGDLVELEKCVALDLFRAGVVLPGPQHTKPISQVFKPKT
jgi:hypothetical protein